MENVAETQVADDIASPVLPERGLVFSEVKYMQLQLCKPKLLPIKSYSLEKLEKMEKKLAQEAKQKREQDRAQRQASAGWTSPDLRHASSPVAAASAATTTSSLKAPASPLPLAPTVGATPVSAAPMDVDSTPINTTPQAAHAASPPSTSGLALTEEEAGADAPMSRQDRTSTGVSASEVSASSHSSTEYD